MNIIPCPSPNFNDRPAGARIGFIILHYTGMESGQAALDRMCDPAAEVSAHYCIEEDGRVFKLVAEDKRAWHAGVSQWDDVENLNHYSIGIELVNKGHEADYPPFPDAQIEALIALCRDIMARHNIDPKHVLGHSDVAPGRKLDPGPAFPWARLVEAGVAAGKD